MRRIRYCGVAQPTGEARRKIDCAPALVVAILLLLSKRRSHSSRGSGLAALLFVLR
ncbi:MAG: hypothetical protein R2932_51410 [Caldilineaceae bacterium]